jgi:membrane protease YdiL (CAAX protease family)
MKVGKSLFICVLISFTAIFGFVQLTNLCVQLFGDWGLEVRNPDQIKTQIDYIQNNFLTAFFISAILPPIYEELVFRAGAVKLFRWNLLAAFLFSAVFVLILFLLPQWVLLILIVLAAAGVCVKPSKNPQKMKDIYIILITAVIFVIYHRSWSQTVYQLLLGIILAVIYIKTNNIYYTMLIHFINNAFIIIYTYYTGTGASAYPVNFGTVNIAVLLAVIACAIIYSLIKELPNEQKK